LGAEPKQDDVKVKTSALQPGVLEELDMAAGLNLSTTQLIELLFKKNQAESNRKELTFGTKPIVVDW
jgi:hypothetical protein